MEHVALFKERMKRKVMRQLQNGEIDYDAKLDKLVYADTKEELEVQDESDVDSDDFWLSVWALAYWPYGLVKAMHLIVFSFGRLAQL